MKLAGLSLATLFLFSTPSLAKTIRLASGERGGVDRQETLTADGISKQIRIQFHLKKLQSRNVRGRYTRIQMDGLPSTSEPGMPSLPFQAITLNAAASDLRIAPILGAPVNLSVGAVLPAQVEPCRCPSPKTPFLDKLESYEAPASGFVIQSLGDFRGQPVSRVLLFPHRYNPKTGQLQVYPNARFEISQQVEAKGVSKSDQLYDYLVITPRALMGGLANWVEWKRASQGLHFKVQVYEDLGSPNTNALKDWIHQEYSRAHFHYALMVGGRSQIPQQIVETTTDKATPSDLPYFTFGGSGDVIPDVLSGRVVADNADSVARILRKWMDYEKDQSVVAGWRREIGIASNEGSGPSDAEYIRAIQDRFKTAFASEPIYLFQNSPDSNPNFFNQQMASGAMWVTYIGHGSGYQWPSFGTSYGIPEIKAMRNAGAVKPIWIDVACLNGILEPANAGAHLVSETDPGGESTGVTAYLGGTVLVSWHPPAIFARGVAFKLAEMVRPTLGEAIQAGQRYLTENTSNLQDIASNQRWYHLQGDPSLRLRLQ